MISSDSLKMMKEVCGQKGVRVMRISPKHKEISQQLGDVSGEGQAARGGRQHVRPGSCAWKLDVLR